MKREKRYEIQQWLLKSQRDLLAAKLLIESEQSLLDVAVYHCQQCVEKALKGYLTYQDVIFQKTHNLSVLLDLCVPFFSDFEGFRDATETLTPYATGFRYPQDAFEPQRNEAETAVEMADSVLAFVVNLLSNDILTAFSEDSTISEDSADDA